MSASEFQELLGELTDEALLNLVADTWAARNRETSVRDDTVVVRDPERDEFRRIVVASEGAEPPDLLDNDGSEHAASGGPGLGTRDVSEADVLVASIDRDQFRELADRHDVRYVGPDDLHAILLYAIDRNRAESLFQQYFDRTPILKHTRRDSERPDGETTSVDGSEAGLAENSPTVDRKPAVNHNVDGKRGESGDKEADRVTASGTLRHHERNDTEQSKRDTERTVADSEELYQHLDFTMAFILLGITALLLVGGISVGVAEWGGDESSGQVNAPPGVDEDGLVNASKLARTHASRIAGRPYRLRIHHVWARGRVVTGLRWIASEQVVRTGKSGDYRYRVNGTLPPKSVGGERRHVDFAEYTNGSNCYRSPRSPSSDESSEMNDCPPNNEGSERFVEATATYIVRYLDTNRTTVKSVRVDGQYRYRVIATGTPKRIDSTVRDYVAIAIVDSAGIVRRLRVNYTVWWVGRWETVRFEFSFEKIGLEYDKKGGRNGSRRHHRVGVGHSESTPAETALPARMIGRSRASVKKRVAEAGSPCRKEPPTAASRQG